MSDKKNTQKTEDNKLNEEVIKLKKEVEELKNKYLRALADYQNFEKRIEQQKNEVKKAGERQLILKLLPFLDNLEKAEVFVRDEGLKQIKNNFFQILKAENLEELDVLNKEFDPTEAEAVEIVPGEKDNIVTEVIRKGYKFAGKVLRVARVKVSKTQMSNPKTQSQ